MKKLLAVTLLLTGGLSPALAQTQSTTDYPKFELYAGFSHNRAETLIGGTPSSGNDSRAGLNGFEAAVTRNVSRYVGAQFSFAAHFGEESFKPTCPVPCPDPPPDVRVGSSLYTFLGGVQVKDNARDVRFKPFVRGLIGVARSNRDDDPLGRVPSCVLDNTCPKSDTGLAAVLGCGLDIRVSRRLDIRLIQFDYNPTRLSGTTLHNVRVGFGFNLH